MFKTIRSQLLSVFLLIVAVSVLSSFVSFAYIGRSTKEIYQISNRVELIDNLLLRDEKIIRDFFSNETINPAFFISRQSAVLEQHALTCDRINSSMDTLLRLQNEYDFELNTEIQELRTKFAYYQRKLNGMVDDILVKGFKDFGIEGQMRGYAHKLERYSDQIGLADVLQLRRHEKDFIIRQDDGYIRKFLDQYVKIKNRLAYNGKQAVPGDSVLAALEGYRLWFEQYVSFSKRLGLHGQTGEKKELDMLADGLAGLNAAIIRKAHARGAAFVDRMRLCVLAIWCIFVLACVILVVIFSGRFSQSVIQLKNKMELFVTSDFTARPALPVKDTQYEIDLLANHFAIMEEHIINQMNALKDRNKEMRSFVYRVSHDLQAPVHSIQKLVAQSLELVSDTEAREYLKQAERAVQAQAGILGELETILNIKEGPLEYAEYDPYELARDCINACRNVPGFDRILFTLNVHVRQRPRSDIRYLKHILKALIENSVCFSKRDSTAKVSITIRQSGRHRLTFSVSDNGIGITEAALPHIFEMFYRASVESRGPGLGLYMARNAVQKLNGTIEVTSAEGKGTTFIVQLPDAGTASTEAGRIIEHRKLRDAVNKEDAGMAVA